MEASSVETSKRPVINARGWLLIGVVVIRLLSGALNIELMNLPAPMRSISSYLQRVTFR